MRKLLCAEQDVVAGGLSMGGFGYGELPGFGAEGGPKGVTFEKSFDSGWSLSAGFNKGGDRGLEIGYKW